MTDFYCPKCLGLINVPDKAAAATHICRKCGAAIDIPSNEDSAAILPTRQNVVSTTLRDSISNTIGIIIATIVILLIGSWSWWLGIMLAGIEAVFVAVLVLVVTFSVVANVALLIATHLGTRPREADETEMRWAGLIRIIETAIWSGSLFVLYRFFFGH